MNWKPMTRKELAERVDQIVVEALAGQHAFAKCAAPYDMGSDCCPEPDSEEVTEKILQLFEEFSPFDLVLARKE